MELRAALEALRDSDLVVPVSAAAVEGREPLSWATTTVDGRTWLLAFTSEETFAQVGSAPGAVPRPVAFLQLGAFWPDPEWYLAVDPGLSTQLLLEAATVVRLARDEPADAGEMPVLQQVISLDLVTRYLGGEHFAISGYAHRLDDAPLPDDSASLLRALGLPVDVDEVYLLRWAMVGPELYRVPYGTAFGGWAREAPPFRGTGFVAGPEFVIREYKVDGVAPPHGSEIFHLPAGGPERRIALFDADQRRWLMVRRPS
ncbi:SseB family protein [Cryptosporangium phraense]|uniref:SseB family protein n=1 Tax=Cryptosporangium phraense TaxID=2593070 RepID=A0A545AR44_9ACTN|nr:SseB family protein [Cryptosporangium phraense]TQS43806.1 SseB family protein [Cryptosporangium phraense]